MVRGRGRRRVLNRGDIFDVEAPGGRRPAVIVTRDVAIPLLSSVTLAGVTSTVRGVPTEVPVGREHGLRRQGVVNCDNLFTLSKTVLGPRRGSLDVVGVRRLDAALRVALDLD